MLEYGYTLEEKLSETQNISSNEEFEKLVTDLKFKNQELTNLLTEARNQLFSLKEQVEQIGAPPSGFGIFLEMYEKDADVLINGRKMRVTISPEIEKKNLLPGREVVLN
ncbi:MAG: hypothetical protein ACKOMW_04700, partial [Actinomycetes bacterium]